MKPGKHAMDEDFAEDRDHPVLVEDEVVPPETVARGRFERYSVGDAGRAASTVVTAPNTKFPFHNDIVVDAARFPADADGGLDLRATSIRGLSHRYYGTVRQDAFAFLTTPDSDWLVVTVADGVSAGAYSHIAAETVARSGCARLVQALERGGPEAIDWHEVVHGLADEIVDRAQQRLGPQDRSRVAEAMATTALFAVVALRPGPSAERYVEVMSIGDTSAWLLRPGADSPWVPLHEVKNSGATISSSATFALPSVPRVLGGSVTTTLRPGDALMLMTDGVGDPLGSGTGDVGGFLASVWSAPPDPLEFAAQVDFARRSYDDDRTVVALWPVADPAVP